MSAAARTIHRGMGHRAPPPRPLAARRVAPRARGRVARAREAGARVLDPRGGQVIRRTWSFPDAIMGVSVAFRECQNPNYAWCWALDATVEALEPYVLDVEEARRR